MTASSDGMHMTVTDTTELRDTYLNYDYVTADGGRPGGGDPVAKGTSRRVLNVPPGQVSLNCGYQLNTKKAAAAQLRLTDPHHYYRSTPLSDLGCTPHGSPGWVIGAKSGATPQRAVNALLAAVSREVSDRSLTARVAPIGYVRSATPTYIVNRKGRPWATAVVTRGRGSDSAVLDLLC